MKSTFQYFLYDNLNRGFLEIREGTVCGRLEGDLVFPHDDIVSRKHCRFSVAGNDIYIEDLSSTNATRVNTVPLRPGCKRRIQLNDVIEFGTQRFILTNQNKFQPAHIEDARDRHPVFRGVLADDGSITSHVTEFTKRTRIILDRYSFQKLRLREALTPRKWSTAMRPKSVPNETPSGDFEATITRTIKRGGMVVLWIGVMAAFGGASSALYLWAFQPDLVKQAGRQIASEMRTNK